MTTAKLRDKDRLALYRIFWVWPLFGITILSIHGYYPNTFRNCLHVLFVPGLIGTVSSSWTILRTKDRCYSLQFIASAITFVAGVYRYWYVT